MSGHTDEYIAALNAFMSPSALGVLLHMAAHDEECSTAEDLAGCHSLEIGRAEAEAAIAELQQRGRYRTRQERTDDGDDVTLVEIALRGQGVFLPPRCVTKVYFVQNGSFIKIGTSGRLNQRLEELYRASGPNLHYIGSVDGGRKLETRLHQRFAGDRALGEWFEASPGLWDYIELEVML